MFFTTRQVLKQNFHNVSDFDSKDLQRVKFCFEKLFSKTDFEQKCAFKMTQKIFFKRQVFQEKFYNLSDFELNFLKHKP